MTNRSRGSMSLVLCALLIGPGCRYPGGSSEMPRPQEALSRIHGIIQLPSKQSSPVVVFARSRNGKTMHPGPARIVWPHGGSLSPSFLVAMVGQEVRFTNRDKLCHRFFSASRRNAFDTGLLRPVMTNGVKFERTGLVKVYCSLHSGEQTSVLVLPTPHFAVVHSTGEFEIAGVAPGNYDLMVWSQDGINHGGSLELSSGETRLVKLSSPTSEVRTP